MQDPKPTLRDSNQEPRPVTPDDSGISERPTHSRQTIPALPDPLSGGFPSPANLGNTRLKPPVSR